MTKPFRWSLANREQLGSLPDLAVNPQPPDRAFCDELRRASARILALSDGADLAFIGRSPENFFDYLSGVFQSVNGAPDLHIVQYSMRWPGEGGVEALPADKVQALFDYFRSEGVDPASIATGPRPLALVDFIASGGTMQYLVELLQRMAHQDGVDWNGVQRRLRIIGLTSRTKNSPNTWRWQQNQTWLDQVPDMVIKNVSADWGFLYNIANIQNKVTHANHPGRWGELEGRQHAPSQAQLDAIAFAVALFDLGNQREERARLAGEMATTHQMRQPNTRALVAALKR